MRRRGWGVALIGVAVLLGAALWLGAGALLDRRARASERARAVAAATLDRRSRQDQVRVWTEVLRADPSSALALGQLAALNVQLARETGQESHYPVAEEMARRSLALRTRQNAGTYLTLATALLAQHRFSEARVAAAAAHELEPDAARYEALLAEIEMELGNYEAAARGFASVGPHEAHLSVGPRLARWAEITGNPARAREILQRLVAEAEQRDDLPREQVAWFHFRLGDHYRRHGSPRRARRSLARALEVNPVDYRAHKAMAELQLANGDAQAAGAHARSAVAVSRTPETLLTLAAALHETGQTEAARAIETEVAAAIGEDGGSFERAWHSYRLDRNMASPDIVSLLEREVRERADVHGYDLLAWAYFKSHRIADARTAILRALRTGTSDPTVWLHAGAIFDAAGDSARASSFRRWARSLGSGHRRAAGVGLAVLYRAM